MALVAGVRAYQADSMLSYRHAFHAGNRADVFKHAVLYAFLSAYTKKEKPFTAFDLNAGSGRYELFGDWSLQTGEAANGILFLLSRYRNGALPEPLPADLKAYLDACTKHYEAEKMYAGSPEIIRSFLRPADELVLTDLHPAEAAVLKKMYKRERNICVHKRNCYEAIIALTPPKHSRGFALFDPSYEVLSDYKNIAETVKKVYAKWRAGSFIVWYPILKRRTAETDYLKTALSSLKGAETLTAEVTHKRAAGAECSDTIRIAEKKGCSSGSVQESGYGLLGSGIIIVNPVFGLKEKISALADYLSRIGFCAHADL